MFGRLVSLLRKSQRKSDQGEIYDLENKVEHVGEINRLENKLEHGTHKGRKKVLVKGDPGMGKTTLVKKFGWDWAKGFLQDIFHSFLYFFEVSTT